MAKFSSRLRQLRQSVGLSQAEFAKQVGTTKSSINMYERGEREPNLDRLETFADYFNVDMDYLLGKSDVPNKWANTKVDNIYPISTKRFPLLGNIACGEPIFADEEHEIYIEAGADIKADFCLKARGDSMTGARILDGDIVFIHKQETVSNGEIAAVLIGDEATLKRVYYDRENNIIQLFPDNPAYSVMRYSGEELNQIRILGKAVALYSELR